MARGGRMPRIPIVGSPAYFKVVGILNPRSEQRRQARVRRRAKVFVVIYVVGLIAAITIFFYFHPT